MMLEDFPSRLLTLAPALLISITIHELAHGWTAFKLGDDTAKRMGRLTLNPLAHLDLLGTACLLLTGIVGWAKPVPINPRRLRRGARDMVLVALAGPVANLCLLAVLMALAKLALELGEGPRPFLSYDTVVSVVGALLIAALLNLGLALFNLLPVPPLDGYRVLAVLLPEPVEAFCRRFQLIFFILLIVALQMGLFDRAVGAVQDLVFKPFLY